MYTKISQQLTHSTKSAAQKHLHTISTYEIIVEAIVIVLCILIHPDFGDANRVFLHHVNARPPLIRTSLSENVSDVRAQHYFQHTSAHPHLVVSTGHKITRFTETLVSKQRLCCHGPTVCHCDASAVNQPVLVTCKKTIQERESRQVPNVSPTTFKEMLKK